MSRSWTALGVGSQLLCVLLCFALAVPVARADAPPPGAAPAGPVPAVAFQVNTTPPEQLKLHLQLERGRTMRTIGIVLVVVGIAAALGAVLSFASIRDRCPQSEDGCWDNLTNLGPMFAGVITTAIAIGGLGAGIPLWVIGSHRVDKAQRALARQAAVFPYVAPTPGGLVAGLRAFSF